jgi:signal transduction histidine kinase/CheY-like chemotaxis protein
MPLVGKSGEVIGLIAILDGKPLLDNETVASALQVFAERAAAELDRLRADEDHEILAEQLRHSQKMEALGLLAGGVAHDFNSLLTAILGASDLILSSAEGWLHLPEEVRLHVAHIRSAARRGTSLTRQLLAFTRKEILRPEPLDLGRVVVEMEPLFRRLIGEHHELAIEAEKRITVHGDRGRIEQIVMNLVLNGADALKTAGRISMEVSSRVVGGQQEAILSVRDNGVGMTEQVQSRIFEPFFTTKPVGKGTGLGLSVVFGEVERLNGRIEVTSSPGKGSEFRVYLPIVAAEPTAGEEPIEPPRAREGETILLCEDEELVRLVTCQTLRIAGFTVLEARDGREALDVARSADMPVDLLISDVIMPRMNGGELVQALRAQWPDLAVLFVSGYTADVLGKDLLANEDQQFLAKPYGPGVLLRVVRDTLDARRIRKTS